MLQKLIDERATLVTEARKLVTDHEQDWSADHEQRHTEMLADVDKLSKRIDLLNKQSALESDLSRSEGRKVVAPVGDEQRSAVERATAHTSADTFSARSLVRAVIGDYEAVTEARALGLGTGAAGGFLVPTLLNAAIVTELNLFCPYRQLATVLSTTNDLSIPVGNSDGTASWIGEGDPITDSDETFSDLVLKAYKLAALVKISDELLADNATNLDAYLAGQFARRFAAAEELAFTSGNGTGKPSGWTSTAQTGVTTASATAIADTELIDLFYALKPGYRRNASWVMNDATISVIRKMKASTAGTFLWQPSLAVGQPDTILGRPVMYNNSMDTIAASKVTIGFGDFSFYYIGERVNGRTLLRLNELYAGNGQIGLRMIERIDGGLTVPEAVKKLVQKSA